jgi:lipopolysaccharide transport system permease protein
MESRFEWLAEMWRYRELLYFFAWREVKVRYRQAALGAAWALLQPLLGTVVFTLFFGRLAGVGSDGIPYPVFVYCALVPWTYFAGVLTQAGTSLVGNANLITKVYFPRVLLPASSAVAGLLDFAIGMSFLAVFMGYYRLPPTWSLLLLPLFVAAMVMVTLGLGLLLGALNVRYRDVKYVIPFLLQLWLFCTPIIYPASIVPARLRPLMALNPCLGIVEGFRACLFPSVPFDAASIGTSLAVAVVLFTAGIAYFRTTERVFADII